MCFHNAYDGAMDKSQASKLAAGTGCYSSDALAQKFPWFDHVQQSMPDAMHTIAVQHKHLYRCFAGKASENSSVVIMQEKALNRYRHPDMAKAKRHQKI